jgi:hypothetical protein
MYHTGLRRAPYVRIVPEPKAIVRRLPLICRKPAANQIVFSTSLCCYPIFDFETKVWISTMASEGEIAPLTCLQAISHGISSSCECTFRPVNSRHSVSVIKMPAVRMIHLWGWVLPWTMGTSVNDLCLSYTDKWMKTEPYNQDKPHSATKIHNRSMILYYIYTGDPPLITGSLHSTLQINSSRFCQSAINANMLLAVHNGIHSWSGENSISHYGHAVMWIAVSPSNESW